MRQIDLSKPITYKNKLKKTFRIKKPIYKNWWIYPLVFVVFLFFIFGIPIIINEEYRANNGYVTSWGAPEVLSFYAVILSGLITITALIITIHFSKKDTEKQLKFYMSQAKAPFLIIEKIYQTNSNQEFLQNDDGAWIKEFFLSKNGKLSEKESGKIEIVLKNIGDGIALAPHYQVDMFASTIIPEHIIRKDTNITFTYDLQQNLDDKWVAYFYGEVMQESQAGYVEFYTNIKLFYQNMLGVDLHQELPITIKLNLKENTIILILQEMSPQKFKIDN